MDLIPLANLLDIRAIQAPDLTKSSMEELSKQIVVPVLNGDINPLDADIIAHFFGGVMDCVQDKLKKIAIDEALKYKGETERIRFGATFKAYEKKATLDYSKDPVIQELEKKIKARKKLIDIKCEQPEMEIVDTETGVTVEVVPQSKPPVTVLQITHGK